MPGVSRCLQSRMKVLAKRVVSAVASLQLQLSVPSVWKSNVHTSAHQFDPISIIDP